MPVDQNRGPQVYVNGELATGDDKQPAIVRDLGPNQIVLLGRLVRPPYTCGKPGLLIKVDCPACLRAHRHGWTYGDQLEALAHRWAHCHGDSPLKGSGYWVGLDPARRAEDLAIAAEYLADLAAWEARHARLVVDPSITRSRRCPPTAPE